MRVEKGGREGGKEGVRLQNASLPRQVWRIKVSIIDAARIINGRSDEQGVNGVCDLIDWHVNNE